MKKDLMEDDRDRDAWLGPMLRQTPLSVSDPCVDPDTLAAWTEGKLDAARAAAVELHASNCARCMAVMAAMERTTPVEVPEERSWAIGPLWRWIVPLTAAATAVAIWVAVPDRETTQPPPAAERQSAEPPQAPQDSSARSSEPARQDAARELALPDAPAPSAPAPETKAVPPPTVDRLEERSAASPVSRDDAQGLDAEKRERTSADAFSAPPPPPAPAMPGAPPPAPSATPVPQQAPAAAARRSIAPPLGAAADAMNQTSALAARQVPAPTEPVVTNTAAAPSNPLVIWRVVDWMSVERSIDGGSSWIKTTLPPGVSPESTPRLYIVSIRVVDNLRGAILTSDRTEFYTVNGGVSWERVQENSVAPF
jgi:hypothetical protein